MGWNEQSSYYMVYHEAIKWDEWMGWDGMTVPVDGRKY